MTVWQYKSFKSGISQKGLWYALGNMEMAAFLIENIPMVKAPEAAHMLTLCINQIRDCTDM